MMAKQKSKVNPNLTISMDAETQGLLEQMRDLLNVNKSRIVSQLVREAAVAMGLRPSDNGDRYK